jgi:coenzyme F420-reducing hydrogenase delta subunit/formate hydrogenlyase subunit 6/NADH:ubiquinone oxidoreductase subunit I
MTDRLYEPRIVVFACNWCSYTAADLAGTTRLKMPACFTVVRVMCSGRVDPLYILQAFALGADAVLVTGCHPGDCHYTSGNLHARRRVDFLKQILDRLGLTDRLEMHYVSAAEATRFQQLLTTSAERIARLGPSPLRASLAALPPHKRDAFRAMLQHLAAQLPGGRTDGFTIPEEMVTEGFGEPEYDRERCIGCGACAASCPEHNIELTDGDGTRTISQFHSRCVRCSTCEQVCPVEALRVVARFDLAAFLSDERRPAVELELATCARCGKPVAPVRQLDHLKQTIEEIEEIVPRRDAVLCAACHRQAHAAEMRQHMKTVNLVS